MDTTFNHQDNPEGLSYLDYMYKQFMETYYHNPRLRSSSVMRLAPLFCKLAFENNFQNNNPNHERLQRLESILYHIYNLSAEGKVDVSKIGLDTSYEQLNNTFGKAIDDEEKAANEHIANTQYKNSPYKVIGPVNFETAKEYGNRSCPDGKLCYTQDKSTWANYTNNGMNNVYIALKQGWENIPAEHDDESKSAYDTYGLSMIFMFFGRDGRLAFCNTMWNHKAQYAQGRSVDHALNKEELSNLLGINLNEQFKELNIQDMLDRGDDLEDIFDEVYDFEEGFAKVTINGKGYNFIDTNRQYYFLINGLMK